MSVWTFLIVAVIVVVGIPAIAGIISDYKLAKAKRTNNSDDVQALRAEVKKLRKRIENLEAIAVADPDGFEHNAMNNNTAGDEGEDHHNHARDIENILERRRSR